MRWPLRRFYNLSQKRRMFSLFREGGNRVWIGPLPCSFLRYSSLHSFERPLVHNFVQCIPRMIRHSPLSHCNKLCWTCLSWLRLGASSSLAYCTLPLHCFLPKLKQDSANYSLLSYAMGIASVMQVFVSFKVKVLLCRYFLRLGKIVINSQSKDAAAGDRSCVAAAAAAACSAIGQWRLQQGPRPDHKRESNGAGIFSISIIIFF